MDGDRSNSALARIEAALRRIEAAAAQPRLANSAAQSEDMTRLQHRHDQLRTTVEGVLAELDQLIEGIPPLQPESDRG